MLSSSWSILLLPSLVVVFPELLFSVVLIPVALFALLHTVTFTKKLLDVRTSPVETFSLFLKGLSLLQCAWKLALTKGYENEPLSVNPTPLLSNLP